MKPILLATAAVAALTVATGGAAEARSRTAIVNTPRGTYTRSHSATCAGGTCSRSNVTTGPMGRSVTSGGSVTRTAPGQFSSTGTATGPNGGTVTRSGSTSCAGGTCNHTGTISGQ